MTDPVQTPAPTSDVAVQWCIEARKRLKLGLIKQNQLDLKKRATAVKDNLKKVLDKFGGGSNATLESDFLAIAGRISAAAESGNEAQVAIEAERLNVLNKQIQLKLAEKEKDPVKAKKSALEDLASAQKALDGKLVEIKTRYEKLLADAQKKLNELRPVKYAVPGPVETLINEAKALVATVGKEDWSGGVAKLGTVDKLVEDAKTAAEEWRKKDLLHAGQQKHYESKQQKLQEVLTELEQVPGTEAQREKAKEAQEAGRVAIVRPQGNPLEIALYDEGYKAIARLVSSTSDLLKQGLEAAAKAQRRSGEDVDIRNAEKAARGALEKLRPLVDASVMKPFELDIPKAVLLSGQTDKKRFGIARLEELQRAIEAKVLERERLRDACVLQLQAAQTAITALLYAPTDSERQALREPVSRLESARTLFAALDFDVAAEILTPLQLTLDQFVQDSDHTPDKLQAAWQREAGSGGLLPKARENIAKLRPLLLKNKVPGANKDVEFLATLLSSELDKIALMATADQAWSRAIKALNEISREIEAQLLRQTELGNFIGQRNSLAEPVTLEIERAEAAIVKLENALKSQGDTGNTLALAKEELAAARKGWEDRMGRAANEGELNAGAALSQFTALANKLEKHTRSPQALDQVIAGGRKDAAHKAFDLQAAAVKTELDTLRALDADAYDLQAKAWTDLRHSAFKEDLTAPTGPHTRMETLKTTVQQAITTARQALVTEKNTAQTRFKEVEKQLKALREQADKSLRHKHRKLFAPFFDGLDRELKDLSGMVGSTSLKTVTAALAELTALANRATKLKGEIEAEPKEGAKDSTKTLLDQVEEEIDPDDIGLFGLFDETPPPQPGDPLPTANFRMVMEAVSAIQLALADKPLGKCLPVQKLMLTEDFKTLQEGLFEKAPEEAFESLRQFNLRVKEAIAKAGTAAGLRVTFNTQLTTVLDRFQALSGYEAGKLSGKLRKLRKDPGAYVKELEKRIVAAKALSREPLKEQRALDDLAKILTEIQAVIDDDGVQQPEQLVKEETAAQARAFQKEKEEKQWKALVVDFKRMGFARAEKAVSTTSGGDASQITDLKKMLAQAESLFEDSGSFLGAVELLDAAKQYADRVIAHPQGLKPAARDQLPKVKVHWKQAVSDFNKSVDDVVKAIQDGNDGEGLSDLFGDDDVGAAQARTRQQEAVAQTVKLLNGLKRLFNANIMDAPIAVIISKQAATNEKRASREQAMKYINDYRDVIRTDPVLLKLMQKDRPFGTVDFYGLNTALRDLDLNIQRAV